MVYHSISMFYFFRLPLVNDWVRFSTRFELRAFKRSFQKKLTNFRKMNVRVVFIVLVGSLLLLHSEAYISINIDPDDLDTVSDFFHQIMINEQPI